MKRLIIALFSVITLSACGQGDENQSDTIDNTPAAQPDATAPTDRDPTPQTSTGGESPATAPSGTTNTPPATPPPSNNP